MLLWSLITISGRLAWIALSVFIGKSHSIVVFSPSTTGGVLCYTICQRAMYYNACRFSSVSIVPLDHACSYIHLVLEQSTLTLGDLLFHHIDYKIDI